MNLWKNPVFRLNAVVFVLSVTQGGVNLILPAMTTRVDGDKDIQLIAPGGMGQTFQPAERSAAAPGAQWVWSESKYSGGIAIDAAVPFEFKWAYERAGYPIEVAEQDKRFKKEEIQSESI